MFAAVREHRRGVVRQDGDLRHCGGGVPADGRRSQGRRDLPQPQARRPAHAGQDPRQRVREVDLAVCAVRVVSVRTTVQNGSD